MISPLCCPGTCMCLILVDAGLLLSDLYTLDQTQARRCMTPDLGTLSYQQFQDQEF